MKILNNKGSTLTFAVIVIFLMTILITAIVSMTVSNFELTRLATSTNSAYYVSDALIEESLAEIRNITYEAETLASEKMLSNSNSFLNSNKWEDFYDYLQKELKAHDKNSNKGLSQEEALERFNEGLKRHFEELYYKELLILVDSDITTINIDSYYTSYDLMNGDDWVEDSHSTFTNYDYDALEAIIEDIEFNTEETFGLIPEEMIVEFTPDAGDTISDFNVNIKVTGNYDDFKKNSEINLDLIAPNYEFVLETNLVTRLPNEILNNYAIIGQENLTINNMKTGNSPNDIGLEVKGNLYYYEGIDIINSNVYVRQGGISTSKILNIEDSKLNVQIDGGTDSFDDDRRFDGHIYTNVLNEPDPSKNDITVSNGTHIRSDRNYNSVEKYVSDFFMHMLATDGDHNISDPDTDYYIDVTNNTEKTNTNDAFKIFNEFTQGNNFHEEVTVYTDDGDPIEYYIIFNTSQGQPIYINPIEGSDPIDAYGHTNMRDFTLSEEKTGIIISDQDIVIRPNDEGDITFNGLILSGGNVYIEGHVIPSLNNKITINFTRDDVLETIEEFDDDYYGHANQFSNFFNLYNGRYLTIEQTSLYGSTNIPQDLFMTVNAHYFKPTPDEWVTFDTGTSGIDLTAINRPPDIKTYKINYWKQVD